MTMDRYYHKASVLTCAGDSPVYKLVLLQILATLCDVSSYVEKVHHGQTGRMLLITEAENPTFVTTTKARQFAQI